MSFLGIDVGGIISGGITVAGEILTNQTRLEIANLNFLAEQATANRQQEITEQNAAQTRILITGGLVLFGTVFAIRLLRKR